LRCDCPADDGPRIPTRTIRAVAEREGAAGVAVAVVLGAGDEATQAAIADRLGICRHSAGKIIRRMAAVDLIARDSPAARGLLRYRLA